MSYTEMELKARNVQHARNLYDRAVTLLPRIDLFWYKYVYLEELLDNIPGARQVFERWMAWEPEDKAWAAYIKMEERYQELERASEIYKRWVAVRPEPRIWVKWAKFEEERGMIDRARDVFDTALRFFGDDEEEVDKAQAVFAAFARMETRLKEYERARVIYKVCVRTPTSHLATDHGTLVCTIAITTHKIGRSVCSIHQIREAAWHENHCRSHCLEQATDSVRR
jgi:crooked neck